MCFESNENVEQIGKEEAWEGIKKELPGSRSMPSRPNK